jgi:hypothetical protein
MLEAANVIKYSRPGIISFEDEDDEFSITEIIKLVQ